MIYHYESYSTRTCSICNEVRTYTGKFHKKTSREAERKNRLCRSCSSIGEKNSCYGRTKEKHPFYGKKRPEHSEYLKQNNVMFDHEVRDRYFLRRFGMIAEEWANTQDGKHLYYLEVIRETKKQDITQLENYDKWGVRNNDYELDHIYPKSKGFYNKIPAALIGDIRNLQIIPAIENNSKNDKIIMIPEHIKEYLDQNSISYDSLRSL